MDTYDAIVLGLGGMGSAAAYHLARRGARVLGLEQFTPGHARGSSHGRSRIFRVAYFEHPDYVPLVLRAHDLWRDLEAEAGRTLLTLTGGAMIGPRHGELVAGAERSAIVHRLPYELADAIALRSRLPVFEPGEGYAAVLEPQAGVLDPEACVAAHLDGATAAGADLHFEEPALSWSARNGTVEVTTPRGRYAAARLLVTSGPWTARVLAGLRLPLAVERNVTFWFKPADLDRFGPDRFPIFIWETQDGRLFYGLPNADGLGLKVARHHAGELVDPDAVGRAVSPGEADEVRGFLRHAIPSADGEPVASLACPYTNTPDGHFILDRHPEHEQVVIASPCSGHGFKFCSVIGEILADLALAGRTRHHVDLFTLSRVL